MISRWLVGSRWEEVSGGGRYTTCMYFESLQKSALPPNQIHLALIHLNQPNGRIPKAAKAAPKKSAPAPVRGFNTWPDGDGWRWASMLTASLYIMILYHSKLGIFIEL